jgi:hypothetical protein
MITRNLNGAFILLLILTMIGGSYMVICRVGGVEVAAYRLTVAIAAVYLLFTGQLKFYSGRFSKYVLIIFFLWIAYGAVSLLWAPSLYAGVQELFYVAVGFAGYIVFFSLLRTTDPADFAEKYWNAGFIAVAGFLVFELLTQRHLGGEHFQALAGLGDFHKANFFPVFTFINPNLLAIYLCISIVFAGYLFLRNRTPLLNAAVIFIALDFLLLTESRLGIFFAVGTLLLSLPFFLLRSVRSRLSLSLSKKQLAGILALAALNVFIFGSGLRLTRSDNDHSLLKNEENEGITARKHFQRLATEGKVLLLSESDFRPSSGRQPTDMVFAIARPAYDKLLDGDKLELKLAPGDAALHRQLFMGSHAPAIYSLSGFFLLLLIVWLFTHREKSGLIIPVFAAGLFLIAVLPRHSFRHTSAGYKKLVLTEAGDGNRTPAANDLMLISATGITGEQLKSGAVKTAFLYDNSLNSELPPVKAGSNTIRRNQVLNGLEYLRSSHYMGIGAGGFCTANSMHRNKYPDGGVVGAHNFLIELLSQYGIFVFLLLMAIPALAARELFRALVTKNWQSGHFLVLWLLAALALMGNANSTFLSSPVNWFLVIFVLIFAGKLMKPEEVANEA